MNEDNKEEYIVRAYKIDPETREEFLIWSVIVHAHLINMITEIIKEGR